MPAIKNTAADNLAIKVSLLVAINVKALESLESPTPGIAKLASSIATDVCLNASFRLGMFLREIKPSRTYQMHIMGNPITTIMSSPQPFTADISRQASSTKKLLKK